jgi:hypothetical protein
LADFRSRSLSHEWENGKIGRSGKLSSTQYPIPNLGN